MWCHVSLLCDRRRPGPQWKKGRSLLRSQTQMSLWLQLLLLPTSPLSTHTHHAWLVGKMVTSAYTSIKYNMIPHWLVWFVWLACFRMLGDSVIPLPHIYGARIKGVEVFCPLEPPPPYEAIAESSTSAVTQVHSEERGNKHVENSETFHFSWSEASHNKCVLSLWL